MIVTVLPAVKMPVHECETSGPPSILYDKLKLFIVFVPLFIILTEGLIFVSSQ